MAPYLEVEKTNSKKLLSILPYLTVFIWPVFNFICNLFKWKSKDYCVETKQNSSPLKQNSYVPISTTMFAFLENLRRQIQQLHEINEGLEAAFSILTKQGKHGQELFGGLFDRSSLAPRIQNGFQKPKMEQATAIEKERQTIKKAVENCVICKSQASSKQMESKIRKTDDITEELETLQCSGGNGSNTPSQNQGVQSTRSESKGQQCNLTTAKPSSVCRNNDEGRGDDDDDPPKRNPEFLKGHYQESSDSPIRQKKVELPDSSCKEQAEVMSKPIACSNNIESSNMVDPLMDDNVDMFLSDDNNEHVETSENVSIESVRDGNGPTTKEVDLLVDDMFLSDGNNETSGNEDFELVVDETGRSSMDLDPSVDMLPSDGSNEHDESLGNEDIANPVSETAEDRHYSDNIPLDRNEQHETQFQRARSPHKIIHPFQACLTVHCDGLYLINRDYIILREIGRGGNGVCYEILDRRSSKKFAVKKIKSSDYQPNEVEIQSMFSPGTSNVVAVLGAYDDGKHVHIFMELMDGTLKYIAEHREDLNVTERRVAAIIKPVLKFLDCLHRRGFVHADIKSDNTFFDSNGIKVGDFGLTVALCAESTTTVNNGGRGTICFMPKELFLGENCKPSVDIYCLGGVIIHLLSGSLPWATYEQFTIIYKVGSGETPDIPNNCSEEMRHLLKLMLQPDHTERPSAMELLQHHVFTDTPESTLDDVLQELLVDIQLFQRPIPLPGPLQNSDALDCAPMSLDGAEEPPNAE